MIEKTNQSVAEDQFEAYFTEKIWEMIPAFYRTEDGLAESLGVLRSIVEIIAEQAAILRRSQDRLWDDQFIELCSHWAIPYIADLLGTRLVSALNQRGRRADVANTIYQRRRSGTLRLLEQLISSITDWDGVVVEKFKRLGRNRHGLDPHPTRLEGRFSKTPPGGTANLRSPQIAELVNGPFNEFAHTADLCRPRGKDGLFGIHKLVFYLYRLKAYQLLEVTPFPFPSHSQFDGERFTFDPSGRLTPLFSPRNRPDDWDEWRPTREWDLPKPIRCRLLSHAEYIMEFATIQSLMDDYGLTESAATSLETILNQEFRSEARLKETLNSFDEASELLSLAIYIPLLDEALMLDCGKAHLLSLAVSVHAGVVEGGISPSRINSANLKMGPKTDSPDKRLLIDPENGIFSFLGDPLNNEDGLFVNYHYGFSGEIGAGGYYRPQVDNIIPDNEIEGAHGNNNGIPSAQIPNEGILQINDSKTYTSIGSKTKVKNLTIQAKNFNRPYLRFAGDWSLNTGVNTESFLTLDGLWIGAVEPGRKVVLRGDYECVTLSHCTFDPGGDVDLFGEPILPTALIIEARIDQLIINQSIMGPIRVEGDGLVESLVICDSIVQSTDNTVDAIQQNLGDLKTDRVTVFGSVDVHRLWVNETIITGETDVTDTQNGCFRFSVAPTGSRLPRPYPYAPISFTASSHWFTSRRFGDPGYGQLSETAPFDLQRGAENGSELGAFSTLINPIKSDSLRAKVAEYMPFGLLPIFINET
ncbi:MAG: hypothetical protein MI974_04970 [Chitinophagales bacterium]|nr:hypothetical protein [Chitinophagales bacterium]